MLYTINSLREELFHHVFEVYEVFQNFFGEESTDLQNVPSDNEIIEALNSYNITVPAEGSFEVSDADLGVFVEWFLNTRPFILVYWPQVIVTNEYDKSIKIDGLYAKIGLTREGRIPYENTGFLLNRATYPKSQFLSNYLHSHIKNIPKDNFTNFMIPCLGSGPINGTIGTLKNECNLTIWMLFCQELSMYVTVESISGVPWNRLENVGNYLGHSYNIYYDNSFYRRNLRSAWTNDCLDLLYGFAKYYLKHGHLKFGFREYRFVPGMPISDFILDISNCFIDYINNHTSYSREEVQDLYNNNILMSCIMKDGKFYKYVSNTRGDVGSFEGKFMCEFKRRSIYIHIYDDESTSTPQTVTILSDNFAMDILYSILKIINYRYKNEHNNRSTATSASQTICYI